MDDLENRVVLEIKNLSFSYPDGEELLSGLNFRLEKGCSAGIWSPNGTGKTSLFKIITGLLKAKSGEILLYGKSVQTEEDFRALRLKVGFVLQHPDDQLFFPEVIDDVAFGPLNEGLSEGEAWVRAHETLVSLGIEHLEHSLSFELSGGQKKLVTLAAVLSMKPDVLLLDEPTNGLDAAARKRLIEIINRFEGEKIIISHDPDMLAETCSRFFTITDKKLSEIKAPQIHEHRHSHFFGAEQHSHN